MTLATTAALAFALLAALVVAFQLALALGAPWGEYAMGGAYPGRYPPRLRLAAIAQAVLVGILAIIVLSHAGLVLPEIAATYPWLIWAAAAFSAVSVLLNAITRSAGERVRWLPVAVGQLITAVTVALAG